MNFLLPARQNVDLNASLRTAWGYTRHELLYLTWALMEVALITPFGLSLMGWARTWPSEQVALWLLLLMLVPFNLVRLMGLLQIPKERQQTIMAVSLLTTALIALRTLLYDPQSLFDLRWLGAIYDHIAETDNQLWGRDLTIFFLTVFAWWRGIRLALRQPDINQVGFRLRAGSLLLALLIGWVSGTSTRDMVPFVLLFFVAALTAVSLVRVEQLERDQSGASASLNLRWLGGIFAASFLVVSAAGILAIIISGDTAVLIAGWLSPLWLALLFGGRVVTLTLGYLATPFLWLLEAILQLLVNVLSRFFTQLFAILEDQGLQITQQGPEDIFGTAMPEEATEIAGRGLNTQLIVILVMVAIVLLVALALGRLYQQAVLAARDSELTTASARDRTRGDTMGQRLWQRLGLLRRWRTAASIRRIYQQMCQAAASLGYPRAESETPYEFLHTLSEVWPDNQTDTSRITEAYVKIRYGELPETKEELEAIKRAWQRLERTKPATLEAPETK